MLKKIFIILVILSYWISFVQHQVFHKIARESEKTVPDSMQKQDVKLGNPAVKGKKEAGSQRKSQLRKISRSVKNSRKRTLIFNHLKYRHG